MLQNCAFFTDGICKRLNKTLLFTRCGVSDGRDLVMFVSSLQLSEAHLPSPTWLSMPHVTATTQSLLVIIQIFHLFHIKLVQGQNKWRIKQSEQMYFNRQRSGLSAHIVTNFSLFCCNKNEIWFFFFLNILFTQVKLDISIICVFHFLLVHMDNITFSFTASWTVINWV